MQSFDDRFQSFHKEKEVFKKYYNSEDLDIRMKNIFDYLKESNSEVIAALIRHSNLIADFPITASRQGVTEDSIAKDMKDVVKLFLLALDYLHFSGSITINFLPTHLQKNRDDGTILITTLTKEEMEKLRKDIEGKNKNKKNGK
jgi:hypothetical protein